MARARNRDVGAKIAELGASNFVREQIVGALEEAGLLLKEYGFSSSQAENMRAIFAHHERLLLQQAIEPQMDLQQLIENSKREREALRSLFAQDNQNIFS